jgi:hypothetical protein
MNEQDFRVALHQSMAAEQAPPPMSDAPVLAAARRDRKRRRATFAGIGSAAAVAAIVIGVAVVVPSGGGSHSPVGAGGARTTDAGPSVTDTTNTDTTNTDTTNTDPEYPEGMTDRTARSGPEYDRGVALANEVEGVLPDGYESPDDLNVGGTPLKRNQAQFADKVNGAYIWEYQAVAPLKKGAGVGELVVEVHAPGNRETGEGCALAPAFWGVTGTCTEIPVNGKAVAVVTVVSEQFDQWAGYRHDDGTVVFVAQSKACAYAGLPALDGLPYTAEQLAELAADPRFTLD